MDWTGAERGRQHRRRLPRALDAWVLAVEVVEKNLRAGGTPCYFLLAADRHLLPVGTGEALVAADHDASDLLPSPFPFRLPRGNCRVVMRSALAPKQHDVVAD